MNRACVRGGLPPPTKFPVASVLYHRFGLFPTLPATFLSRLRRKIFFRLHVQSNRYSGCILDRVRVKGKNAAGATKMPFFREQGKCALLYKSFVQQGAFLKKENTSLRLSPLRKGKMPLRRGDRFYRKYQVCSRKSAGSKRAKRQRGRLFAGNAPRRRLGTGKMQDRLRQGKYDDVRSFGRRALCKRIEAATFNGERRAYGFSLRVLCPRRKGQRYRGRYGRRS